MLPGNWGKEKFDSSLTSPQVENQQNKWMRKKERKKLFFLFSVLVTQLYQKIPLFHNQRASFVSYFQSVWPLGCQRLFLNASVKPQAPSRMWSASGGFSSDKFVLLRYRPRNKCLCISKPTCGAWAKTSESSVRLYTRALLLQPEERERTHSLTSWASKVPHLSERGHLKAVWPVSVAPLKPLSPADARGFDEHCRPPDFSL